MRRTDSMRHWPLPPLPLGYHYPQLSTDRSWGRAGGGIWAKDRNKIYIAPWIQSTETVLVKWDGIKRVWSDGDPIDDDPLLSRAVEEYIRWKHAEKYDHEASDVATAKAAYEETRALLMHQCREETRARLCEPSLARSAPDRIVNLYYNDAQTVTVSCPPGETGASVTVTIAAGTVGSSISKDDANQKAKDQAQTQAQAQLDCSEVAATFTNTQQTATVGCHQDPNSPTVDGNPVTVTIPAGQVTSDVSQADADQQALAMAQGSAAQQLHCVYWNRAMSFTATCPHDQTVTVTMTTPERTYSSTLSQVDADNQALLAATNAANAALVCPPEDSLYWNTPQLGQWQTSCGVLPTRVVVTVAAHYVSDPRGVAYANAIAQAAGQAYAQQQAQWLCLQHQTGTFNFSLP